MNSLEEFINCEKDRIKKEGDMIVNSLRDKLNIFK